MPAKAIKIENEEQAQELGYHKLYPSIGEAHYMNSECGSLDRDFNPVETPDMDAAEYEGESDGKRPRRQANNPQEGSKAAIKVEAEANVKAERIINSAKAEAKNIIDAAKAEAERLLEEATAPDDDGRSDVPPDNKDDDGAKNPGDSTKAA